MITGKLSSLGNRNAVPIQGAVSEVFRQFLTKKKKPWIEIENATSDELVNQVKKCPSGALGYYYKEKE